LPDRALRTLVAVDSGLSPFEIANLLPTGDDIEMIGVVEGMDESWRTLEETTVDLLIVACLGYSDRALFLVEGSSSQDPNRPVVVLTHGSPNGFVKRVFEAGADDLIVLPQTPEDIRFAIMKAVARKMGGRSGGGETGRLVAVLGPKGGTGKTLTSVNLAVALAESGHRTAVVDLDLQFGDVALTLGISPTPTIHDLLTAGGTLDAAKLRDYMAVHDSGVRALLAPTRPDQASVVTIANLREIYSTLRAEHDYVVVDTPPGFTPEVIATIDSSSDLVIVGMLDALSLKNTKLGLETLQIMGFSADRIVLVLNRAQTKVGISGEDVAAVLGRRPDIYIPSDREVPRALSMGAVIVADRPQTEAASRFRELADLLVSQGAGSGGLQDAMATTGAEVGYRRRLFGRRG
jgi:pilus assembly protein CpaE